jgi:uncharacterized membrane-anchored protein
MNLLGVLIAAGVGGMAMLGLNRYFVQLSASQTDLTILLLDLGMNPGVLILIRLA